MKNYLYPFFTAALASLAAVTQARADVSPLLLDRLAVIVQNCAVAEVRESYDHRSIQSFVSRCQVLQIQSNSKALIYDQGQWYQALVTENADSDGGDLDDLTIRNAAGQVVATRTAFPAFDNVIFALAGHGAKFTSQNL